MTFIKEIRLSPSQARELKALGFVLKLKQMGREADLYQVWVRE